MVLRVCGASKTVNKWNETDKCLQEIVEAVTVYGPKETGNYLFEIVVSRPSINLKRLVTATVIFIVPDLRIS